MKNTLGDLNNQVFGQKESDLMLYADGVPIHDPVNAPTHYHKNGIDVIAFSELQFSKEELKGFYRINILKYVTRYDRKNGIEDLKKAEFYLNKLIKTVEGQGNE